MVIIYTFLGVLCVLCISLVSDSVPLLVGSLQVLLSVEFSRREYWSALPFPPSGDLPNPEIKPKSLMFPALEVGSFPLVPPGVYRVW